MSAENPSTAITRWREVEALFHRALELPEGARTAEVLAWCGGDEEMAQEVMDLLEADSSVQLKMQSGTAPSEGLTRDDSDAETGKWIGRLLGSYRLERVLGRGGMGVVYLAERVTATEGSARQEVAVKLVRRNLRNSPAVQHFLLERDALARLEHANIARLLDGGVTDEGLPYVVMEYVEGRRLDAVCDQAETSVEAVVGYMLQLCGAVTYVHRNLILHRDLKPGNVMVTGDSAVKLLDFGTLKLMGPEAVDSAMTQAGMRPVTLRYASPEHIQGSRVSTASEVYSLGVMLYRLIAGRLPEGMENLPISEYLERLREGRMRQPSTLAVKRMGRGLAADLDAIVMKSMRFEPEARYATADALAAELTRALEQRPVEARGDSRRYRAAKFYQRNWGTMGAAAAMAAVLTTGLVAMAREAGVARTESARADAGVEQEQKLAHYLLFDYFEQLKQIPGSTSAQRKAVSQSLNYLAGVSQTTMSASAQLDNIQAYTEMGSLLGSPYEENLGDVPAAIATLEKGVSLSQHLLATDPQNLSYLQSASAAQLALGRVYFGSGDTQKAVKYLLPAADTSRRIATYPQVQAPELAQAASAVDALGDLYGQEGAATLADPAKAVERYRGAQEIDAAGLRKDPACARCRRGVALEYWKIGMLVDDEAQAGELFKAGLATLAVFSPPEQATTRVIRMDTVLRQRLGTVYLHDGHVAEGLSMLESVRQRFLAAVAADPVDARARFDLVALDFSRAEGFDDLSLYDDEAKATRELLDNIETLLRQDPENKEWLYIRAQGLLRDGKLLDRRGEKADGQRASLEGLNILVRLAQRSDAAGNVLGAAADALTAQDRDAPMAVDFARRAIASTPHPSGDQMLTLAQAQRFAGLAAESRASAQSAIAMLKERPRSESNAAKVAQATKLLQP